MTIEELAKLCLQMLEQDSETDLMDTTVTMDELQSDGTYSEYVLNMEHALYSGLVRYVNKEVLPIQEHIIEASTQEQESIRPIDRALLSDILNFNVVKPTVEYEFELSDNGKCKFFRIKNIYAIDENGKYQDVKYRYSGAKIRILNYNDAYEYHILYSPRIHSLRHYIDEKKEIDTIWKIELNDLNVDDELAINLKYLVYAELKMDENPSVALQHRNIFEQNLDEYERPQIANNSGEVIFDDWGYGYGY